MIASSHRLFLLLFCFLLPGVYGTGWSDTEKIETAYAAKSWMNLGIVSVYEVGAGPGVAFSSSLRDGILIVRFYHVSPAAFHEPLFSPEGRLAEFLEFGFLVGKQVSRSWATASATAGFGWAIGNGKPRVVENSQDVASGFGPRFPDEDFAALSLPLEAQIFFSPSPMIGVGFSFLGNINAHESVWGLILGVQFRGWQNLTHL
jgi:hypothetical protein